MRDRINEINPNITVRSAEDVRRAESLAVKTWLCRRCKHYNDDMTCTAFPDGIPLEIVSGVFLHLRPVGVEAEPVAFEEAPEPRITDL